MMDESDVEDPGDGPEVDEGEEEAFDAVPEDVDPEDLDPDEELQRAKELLDDMSGSQKTRTTSDWRDMVHMGRDEFKINTCITEDDGTNLIAELSCEMPQEAGVLTAYMGSEDQEKAMRGLWEAFDVEPRELWQKDEAWNNMPPGLKLNTNLYLLNKAGYNPDYFRGTSRIAGDMVDLESMSTSSPESSDSTPSTSSSESSKESKNDDKESSSTQETGPSETSQEHTSTSEGSSTESDESGETTSTSSTPTSSETSPQDSQKTPNPPR